MSWGSAAVTAGGKIYFHNSQEKKRRKNTPPYVSPPPLLTSFRAPGLIGQDFVAPTWTTALRLISPTPFGYDDVNINKRFPHLMRLVGVIVRLLTATVLLLLYCYSCTKYVFYFFNKKEDPALFKAMSLKIRYWYWYYDKKKKGPVLFKATLLHLEILIMIWSITIRKARVLLLNVMLLLINIYLYIELYIV